MADEAIFKVEITNPEDIGGPGGGGLTEDEAADLASTATNTGATAVATGLLAALISSGALPVRLVAGAAAAGSVILGAGSAAFGKLAANAGVIIGAVEIAASQTIGLAAGSAAIGKLAANSGVDIGDVDVTSVSPPSSVFHGNTSFNTTATALGSSQALKRGVRVTALLANSAEVYVGITGVTTSTGAPLQPGESLFVEVDNLATVFVIAAAAQNVRYIAS